jgi:ATP-dependent DNA helicase RecG
MTGQGPRFDVKPFLNQDEGQHFDRKSLFHGPPGEKQPRDRREVRDQVARYVAGFANAEGGVLMLGIEDDHSITGHRLPPKALESLLAVTQARLQPPQPHGFLVSVDGQELVVFDVPSADGPVQVTGDGFPLRIGDQTIETSESKIRALKFQGLVESYESRPSPLGSALPNPPIGGSRCWIEGSSNRIGGSSGPIEGSWAPIEGSSWPLRCWRPSQGLGYVQERNPCGR